MAMKKLLGLPSYCYRLYLDTKVGISSQNPSLAFRQRKIFETNSQRDHFSNIQFIETITIPKELYSKVTPASLEQLVHLLGSDVIGIERLIYKSNVGVVH